MLHHDDRIGIGCNAVCAARTSETGLRMMIVTNRGGVYVTIGVDLRTADESDETVFLMEVFVDFKTDETNVRPNGTAVSHESQVTNGTRYFNRGAVHEATFYDDVAVRSIDSLSNAGTDQGEPGPNGYDLTILICLAMVTACISLLV